jgi:hypothetical protein
MVMSFTDDNEFRVSSPSKDYEIEGLVDDTWASIAKTIEKQVPLWKQAATRHPTPDRVSIRAIAVNGRIAITPSTDLLRLRHSHCIRSHE